jgi:hypothetical protein
METSFLEWDTSLEGVEWAVSFLYTVDMTGFSWRYSI